MAKEGNSKKRLLEGRSSSDPAENGEQKVVMFRSNGTGGSQYPYRPIPNLNGNQDLPKAYKRQSVHIDEHEIPPQFVQVGSTFEEPRIRMLSSVMGSILSVTGPGQFCVILNKDIGRRNELEKKMADVYRDRGLDDPSQVEPELLVPGLIVACHFDNSWVRGRIIYSSTPDFFQVFLLDYAKYCNLESSFIRYLNLEFLSVPVLALESELALTPTLPELPTWKSKTLDFYRGLLVGRRAMKSFYDLVFPRNIVSIKFFPPAPNVKLNPSQVNKNWEVELKVTTCGIHPDDRRTVSVVNEMIINEWYAPIQHRYIRPERDEEGFCCSNS